MTSWLKFIIFIRRSRDHFANLLSGGTLTEKQSMTVRQQPYTKQPGFIQGFLAAFKFVYVKLWATATRSDLSSIYSKVLQLIITYWNWSSAT